MQQLTKIFHIIKFLLLILTSINSESSNQSIVVLNQNPIKDGTSSKCLIGKLIVHDTLNNLNLNETTYRLSQTNGNEDMNLETQFNINTTNDLYFTSKTSDPPSYRKKSYYTVRVTFNDIEDKGDFFSQNLEIPVQFNSAYVIPDDINKIPIDIGDDQNWMVTVQPGSHYVTDEILDYGINLTELFEIVDYDEDQPIEAKSFLQNNFNLKLLVFKGNSLLSDISNIEVKLTTYNAQGMKIDEFVLTIPTTNDSIRITHVNEPRKWYYKENSKSGKNRSKIQKILQVILILINWIAPISIQIIFSSIKSCLFCCDQDSKCKDECTDIAKHTPRWMYIVFWFSPLLVLIAMCIIKYNSSKQEPFNNDETHRFPFDVGQNPNSKQEYGSGQNGKSLEEDIIVTHNNKGNKDKVVSFSTNENKNFDRQTQNCPQNPRKKKTGASYNYKIGIKPVHGFTIGSSSIGSSSIENSRACMLMSSAGIQPEIILEVDEEISSSNRIDKKNLGNCNKHNNSEYDNHDHTHDSHSVNKVRFNINGNKEEADTNTPWNDFNNDMTSGNGLELNEICTEKKYESHDTSVESEEDENYDEDEEGEEEKQNYDELEEVEEEEESDSEEEEKGSYDEEEEEKQQSRKN